MPISGLEEAEKIEDLTVFHAGTAEKDGVIVNSGGRVLGVTGLGDTVADAIEKAYAGVNLISWPNVHYRTDIGGKAFKKQF